MTSQAAASVRPIDEGRLGVLYGLLAYGTWGVAPLFWRALDEVPAIDILGHRVLWALPFLLPLLAWRRRLPELRGLARPRLLTTFGVSGLLLCANWFIFLYSIHSEQTLQASLGYFINPILNVVLGMVFLGERLRPAQWTAVGLATVAVIVMTIDAGTLPWLSLLLAASFGLYGLVRKTAPADALLGSNLEMLLLLPVAALFLTQRWSAGAGEVWTSQPSTAPLLLASGALTAFPLLWFSNSARRVSLTTLGFLQYLAPTGQFALAVWVFREPFRPLQLAGFAVIWTALATFTWDARSTARRNRALRAARVPAAQ
ncbi:MAG TPA: EamA family transporter RarD [Thermoanaerobaculia bacterium]|nr:EamA family transporter RarD [Thermoanaerobaculia bacterium]